MIRANNVFLPKFLEYDVEPMGQATKTNLTDLASTLSFGTLGNPTTLVQDAEQAKLKYSPFIDKNMLTQAGYTGPKNGDNMY